MIPESNLYVSLLTKWQVPQGKAVYCTGSYTQLGSWDPKKSVKLTSVSDKTWHAKIKLQFSEIESKKLEYKFFMADNQEFDNNSIVWQTYQGNRTIDLATTNQNPQNNPLKICSFNIRYLTPRDEGQINWKYRRALISKYLNTKKYDIIGIQQATLPQRLYLQQQLKQYDYYGKERESAKEQECGIFVLRDKYTVVLDQYQWISETKQEGVVGYDGKYARYFTSLVITPKVLSSQLEKIPCLAVMNTHFDHKGNNARKFGIIQTLQKSSHILQNLPPPYILTSCIIMGDLNLPSNHKHLNQFQKNPYLKFNSMRQIKDADQSFTFNGFQSQHMLNINDLVINEKLTIDHMYYWINEDWIRPVEFVVDRKSEKYLSDHFPIVGKFLWNM